MTRGVTFRLGFVTGATPDKWAGTWRERQREPIELVPVTEDVQEHGVRTGALDMALVRLPMDRDGLHLIPLYDELPVAVLNVDNELTLLDEVTTEDLADEHQDWTGLTVREAVETVAAGTGVARRADVGGPAAPPQGRHLPDGDRPAVDHDRARLAGRERRPAGPDLHRHRPGAERAQLARLTHLG